MPRNPDYETYTDQEIRDRIKALCLDQSTPPEIRRSILKALKDHSFVSSLPPGEARGLLEELHLRLTPRKEELRQDVKTALPPLPTKHLRWDWGGNLEGMCQMMILAWALSLTRQPNSHTHPKTDFFESSSIKVRPRPTHQLTHADMLQRRDNWFDALKQRNLSHPFLSPDTLWTCENTLGHLQLLRIDCLLYKDFFNEICNLVEKLPSYMIDKFIIIAGSTQLDHTVGLSIARNYLYTKVRFLDPNSPKGELVVALSRSDRPGWIPKIQELITASGFRADAETDFTFYVFAMDSNRRTPPTQSLRTNLTHQHMRSFSPNDRLKFMYVILRIGGAEGLYLKLFKKLWHEPSEMTESILTTPTAGRTLQSIAAVQGYEGIFREFLNSSLSAQSLLQARPVDGLTTLNLAVKYKHLNVVRLLVNCERLPPELLLQPCTDGSTPLLQAVSLGYVEGVSELVNCERLPPELLLQHRRGRSNPLFKAVEEGNAPVVRVLVNCRRLPEELLLQTASGSRTPLNEAVSLGHVEVVRELVNCERLKNFVLLLEANPDRATPLYRAVFQGRADLVQVLVNCRRLPSQLLLAPNVQGSTPLCEAAHLGHVAVVRELLKCTWISPDLLLRSNLFGTPPMFVAMRDGHYNVVREFLNSTFLGRVRKCNMGNMTPLEYAKTYRLPKDIIQKLEET